MRILTALLLVSSIALGQVNTTKKITFKEGETQKIGVNISGLTSITRVEVTFRNSLNAIVRKFSTVDTTITLSDSVYTFSFTDLQTIGKAGRGTWQVEIRSEAGVKKTDVYTYEIYKATTLTGSTTPATAGEYNYLFEWDFTPTTPTFDVIASGIIIVDGQNIKELVSDSLDAIRLLIGTGGIDTTALLRKTTAAALYVAKAAGQSLITDAERSKLSGIQAGATANSTDVQLRDRATHTGTQLAATVSNFDASVATTAVLKANNLSDIANAAIARTNLGIATVGSTGAYDDLTGKPTLGTSASLNVAASGNASAGQVVKGDDSRLTDARTPTAHTHPQSEVTGLDSTLGAKSDSSHTHTAAKITDWVSAWATRFAAQSTTGLAEGTNLYYTDARVQAVGDARYLTPATAAATYQPTLVSGTNIKTVNGTTLLGSGDITISGGGGAWGSITGTLSAQTDLQTALNEKANIATPTFTTNITTPLVIGGTGTTSPLTLRATSGAGTTNSDIIMQVGNNGATEAVRVFSGGNVGIGTGTTNNGNRLNVNGNISAANFVPTAAVNYGLGLNGTQLMLSGTGGVYFQDFGQGTQHLYSAHAGTKISTSGGARTLTASAALEVTSTTKGFLPPRMTGTQAAAIASKAEGLMVYVTDTTGGFAAKGWYGWNGAAWEKLNP